MGTERDPGGWMGLDGMIPSSDRGGGFGNDYSVQPKPVPVLPRARASVGDGRERWCSQMALIREVHR